MAGITAQRLRQHPRLPRAVPASTQDALRLLGIRYQVTGNEATASCPLRGHDDRRPSWSLNIRTGAWNCFGCQRGGGLRKLVMLLCSVPYEAADAWVSDVVLDQPLQVQGTPAERAAAATRAVADPDADVRALDVLMQLDPTDPPDWALYARGISREAADMYRIGWDDEAAAWVFLMISPYTGEFAGYQVKSEETGEVLNSSGVHKTATLFGIELAETGRPVVVVESPIDAARVWTATGITAVASFGSALSFNQVWLLGQKRVSTVVFALDDDAAGHLGTQKAVSMIRESKLYAFEFRTSVFAYPPGIGKDPGDLTDDEIITGLRYARPQ